MINSEFTVKTTNQNWINTLSPVYQMVYSLWFFIILSIAILSVTIPRGEYQYILLPIFIIGLRYYTYKNSPMLQIEYFEKSIVEISLGEKVLTFKTRCVDGLKLKTKLKIHQYGIDNLTVIENKDNNVLNIYVNELTIFYLHNADFSLSYELIKSKLSKDTTPTA